MLFRLAGPDPQRPSRRSEILVDAADEASAREEILEATCLQSYIGCGLRTEAHRMAACSWITRRPHPEGVEACIRNTNINVWGLLQRRREGMSDAEILVDIQGLTPADLVAAWDYARVHSDEVERFIRLNAEA